MPPQQPGAPSSVMETTVKFALDENEPMGVRPNEGLVITAVQPGTPAYGHLKEGDKIQAVNGRRVKDLREFYQASRAAHPIAVIFVLRPRLKQDLPEEVKPASKPTENLPADIAMAITRRHGYHYQLVRVVREKGKKFGLAIKTRDNRVIVCSVEEGSLCAGHLQQLDHIVYVNGTRVTQADVAHPLLIKAMKEQGVMECVIGRPATPEAIQAAQQALRREDEHDPPSVRLNLDVQQIMRQQLVHASVNTNANTRGILSSPGQPPAGRVSFGTNHQLINIQSDNAGRFLKFVNAQGSPNSPIRR